MNEIILNERQWIEDTIASASLGNKPSETLGRLVKYYHALGYKKNEAAKMLEEFIIRCDPTANIVRWQSMIDGCLKWGWKSDLIQIDPIPITKSEMKAISELTGVTRQRLMFTLLCIAKYGNAVNPNNNSWVSRDMREVVAMANINASIKYRALLFNDLWQKEYISYSKVVDNINVNVLIIDNDSEDILLRIDDFRNLGNQYMQYIGEKYMSCHHCGLVVRRTSPNQKYCKACSVDINIQKTAMNRNKLIA